LYDVIVVGAGPGGATSAYHLARAGLKTLLLEKEKMPRYKPCGGGVTAKVKGVLDLDFSPTVEDTIQTASVACSGERLRVEYDAPLAWMVMRDKFDLLLAQHASGAGAEVRDGEPVKSVTFERGRVRVSTSNETLEAKLIVGADGANGIVRRAAGFPRHQRMAVALEAEVETSSAALEEWRSTLHVDFGNVRFGYAWIFPKVEHLSIGIGALSRPGRPVDLRGDLARYVQSEPSLRNSKERSSRGHRIPLGGGHHKYHTGRTLLVGDAAGVVDPFSAEGIYYAIRTGKMAAEQVKHAFDRGERVRGAMTGFDLAAYTDRVNTEINSDFRYAWWLAQAFYRYPDFALRTYKRSTKARAAAAELLGGHTNYGQLVTILTRSFVQSRLLRARRLLR
jgi:geranylgeranyl reductase family protein